MERAGKACFDWIYDNAPTLFPKQKEESTWKFHVVCGRGNNGGDGLIIAKNLLRNGYAVQIYCLAGDKASAGFKAAEAALGKYKKDVISIATSEDIPDFPGDEVIVDCLFGIGLSRPVEGLAGEVIGAINYSGSKVLSIDIPSGLFADGDPLPKKSAVVKAGHILTFQAPKLAFLLPENEMYVGKVSLIDIQLDEEYLTEVAVENHFTTLEIAASLYRPRSRFGHKGTFGTAMIIAGSYGSMGAATMAVRAAARAGCGMVMAHVPQCGLLPMQIANPEAKVTTADGETFIDSLPDELSKFDAIGIGPGTGTHPATAKALKLLLQNYRGPLILDADALNILAENPTWLTFLPPQTILTPHPGEFRRLAGKWNNDLEMLQLQRDFCRKFQCYLILKGRYSSVCFPDGRIFFNSSGNSGMATAGSGDVLTGLLTGLRAAGYSAAHGAIFATWLHGMAGDVSAAKLSPEAMLATDIIDNLAAAFCQIAQVKNAL